jgi:hypothetical protein
MNTRTTTTLQHEKPATFARTGRSRIRLIVFWATTFAIVAELVAGSVWNLVPIDWVEAQLRHLGYPGFFAYILGAWQVAAAVAIIVPGFPLIKEWAYVGGFFLWSGAAASHLTVGDGPSMWGPPLGFAMCAIVSWVLRPADRRLPATRSRRDRAADAGRDGAGPPGTRSRAWVVSIGLLVVLYAGSILTLPVVDDAMRERAVELGWIDA